MYRSNIDKSDFKKEWYVYSTQTFSILRLNYLAVIYSRWISKHVYIQNLNKMHQDFGANAITRYHKCCAVLLECPKGHGANVLLGASLTRLAHQDRCTADGHGRGGWSTEGRLLCLSWASFKRHSQMDLCALCYAQFCERPKKYVGKILDHRIIHDICHHIWGYKLERNTVYTQTITPQRWMMIVWKKNLRSWKFVWENNRPQRYIKFCIGLRLRFARILVKNGGTKRPSIHKTMVNPSIPKQRSVRKAQQSKALLRNRTRQFDSKLVFPMWGKKSWNLEATSPQVARCQMPTKPSSALLEFICQQYHIAIHMYIMYYMIIIHIYNTYL